MGDNKTSINSLQRVINSLYTSNILQSKLRTENYTRSSTKDYIFLTFLNYVPNESTKVEEPLNFKYAWFNNSLSDRKGWRESICDEFETMKKKEVWKIVNRNDVPKNKKILSMRWVFKVKNDGRYRSRLVEKVFNQVEGVDYHFSHSPVLNYISIRILLSLILKESFTIKIIDITKAFLESDLEEEIYIHKPPGYNIVNGLDEHTNQLLKLNKAVYGLVQASKCFYRRITTFLSKKLGFEISRVDPCLMRKVCKENNKKCSFDYMLIIFYY